ncbi:hypothetical protein ACFY2W_19865 [Streptomyces sp. NPDC001262]|uniref:hypothetical protein n=1 Tax=Streptomyces TaxID=1883 RepID=UPI0036C9BFB9
MAKQQKSQLGARIDDEALELARVQAEDRGLSLGDYIAQLIREEAGRLRARGLDAARRFLDEHQAVFDEAEAAGQQPLEYTPRDTGGHPDGLPGGLCYRRSEPGLPV